jgi:hypothetical protein
VQVKSVAFTLPSCGSYVQTKFLEPLEMTKQLRYETVGVNHLQIEAFQTGNKGGGEAFLTNSSSCQRYRAYY